MALRSAQRLKYGSREEKHPIRGNSSEDLAAWDTSEPIHYPQAFLGSLDCDCRAGLASTIDWADQRKSFLEAL